MSAGWTSAALGELCEFRAGLWKGDKGPLRRVSVLRNTNFTSSGELDFSDVAQIDVEERSFLKRRLQPGDIILEKSGGGPKQPVGRVCIFNQAAGDFSNSNFTSALTVKDRSVVEPRYLLRFLMWCYDSGVTATMQSHSTGIRNLNGTAYKSIFVPLPSLAEQQRIVAILDEAFDGIDAAIALVEAQKRHDREWRTASLSAFLPISGKVVTLADHIDMLVGFAFKSTDYVSSPEAVRLLRGDNVMPGAIRWDDAKALPKDRANEFGRYSLAVDDIVVAMDRPWIKAGLKQARLKEHDVPSLLVQRVARLRCKPSLRVGYLQHIIASSLFEAHVLDHAGGSGVPHISGGQLGAFSFILPTVQEQTTIVERLDSLELLHSSLTEIRAQKLAALAELKQSLLARAFSGELTAKPEASNDSVFATPEQTANILAFMHWRHERANRNRFFGHVMAQKSLDLVERVGGVELGRLPYKDAAGPNDKPHMTRAEAWARENQFFEFVERTSGGYDFKKLANYGAMLSAAKTTLKPIEAELGQVANILVGKDKVQAEIFATVLAAWNNLIIDGKDATEAAILREARDDWHPDKIDLPVAKFQDAISEIRRLALVPNGAAKAVRHKQAALF